MLSIGGFWMNTRMPGTAASFCDSERATSSALMLALAAGLEVDEQPALVHRASARRRPPTT